MVNKNVPMSFVMAMKDFFGMKPGQKLGEFSNELKALDEKDRAYFKKGLEDNGYIIQ